MSNLKILFVASEINPFLDISYISKIVRSLAKEVRSRNAEVRVLVPKFGIINDGRNRLHEVSRLSGITVNIGKDRKDIIIKVSSIREERIQVYFIDNKDYFGKKNIFKDKQGNFLKNNGDKLIFFSKGVLETIKELKWSPNVVHCNGWYSSLVPMYLKTKYKDHPLFKNTKSIFSIYEGDNYSKGLLSNSLVDLEPLLSNELCMTVRAGDLPNSNPSLQLDFINSSLNSKNSDSVIEYKNLINIGTKYADVVTNIEITPGSNSDLLEKNLEQKSLVSISINLEKLGTGEQFIPQFEKIYGNLVKAPEAIS